MAWLPSPLSRPGHDRPPQRRGAARDEPDVLPVPTLEHERPDDPPRPPRDVRYAERCASHHDRSHRGVGLKTCGNRLMRELPSEMDRGAWSRASCARFSRSGSCLARQPHLRSELRRMRLWPANSWFRMTLRCGGCGLPAGLRGGFPSPADRALLLRLGRGLVAQRPADCLRLRPRSRPPRPVDRRS